MPLARGALPVGEPGELLAAAAATGGGRVWERIWRIRLSPVDEGGAGMGPRPPGRGPRPAQRRRGGWGKQAGKGGEVLLVTDGQGSPSGASWLAPSQRRWGWRRRPWGGCMCPGGKGGLAPPWAAGGEEGYDREALRSPHRRGGIRPSVPRCRHRRERGRRAGPGAYRPRWVVEGASAWLGRFRRLLVRWGRSLQADRPPCPSPFILIRLDRLWK